VAAPNPGLLTLRICASIPTHRIGAVCAQSIKVATFCFPFAKIACDASEWMKPRYLFGMRRRVHGVMAAFGQNYIPWR
jgi:hypothetical protein